MSMIGKSLAHYSITAQIGKGGMGEVYQATDTKLGRDVAIKVLPEEFAQDTDRVARFQREAKLLASLNHPNIAAIHGLEEVDGTNFLVMELVEGQTLDERIKSGPIPVEEALKLALQIAEALEAAHEKGVIHRDLKPANIKVTPDGKVKVLDFGLAKAYAGDPADINLSNSPTLSALATQQGLILGTAAYMSPEQARGKPVDKRTDVWAFGCVLYEMLTGQVAFQGEDVTEILAAVVKSSVNMDLLPANIHPRISEVLSRCLQKDQKKRYGGIGEAQYEIERVLADPNGVFAQPSLLTKPKKKLRVELPWFATAIALTALIIGVAVWYLKPLEPRLVQRLYYPLPKDQQFGSSFPLAVSLDGTKFVYVANGQLYLKEAGELEAKPVQGTEENPMSPFFSPRGQWIGYFSIADRQLKKIAVSGGAPKFLCEAGTLVFGASWNEDNTIVYGQFPGGIMRVSADGGTPEPLAGPVEGALPLAPQILPDGKTLLITRSTGPNDPSANIELLSLESGESEISFEGAFAQYLPTGHIVFNLDGNLYAVPVDLNNLELKSGSVPIEEGVMEYAISDEGTLLYIPGTGRVSTYIQSLVWSDREGNEEPLEAESNIYQDCNISPNGTQVACSIASEGNPDIYVWDTVRKIMTRLNFNDASDRRPLWTPDGERIVFSSSRDEGIYWKKADGTGKTELLLASDPDKILIPRSWSSDGKILVLEEIDNSRQGEGDIVMLSMEGEKERIPLPLDENDVGRPQVSPDGRWIAYTSFDSEDPEIFVRPFPNANEGRWQVSTNGGDYPRWSPDGRELFYECTERMMSVSVETEPVFKPAMPKILFTKSFRRYDIHPDGDLFLLIKPPERTDDASTDEVPNKIIVVTNWFEELKDRVPVD